MNILVFSWRDPKHPLAGGAEQVMHEHMKGWIKAGHQVTLFSSHFKSGARKEKLDDILIIRYGYQLLGVHLAGFFWYFFGKHKKFDLVVDQFHGIPFFTPFYVRVSKLAVLQEVAREVWFVNHLPKPFNWIVGWLGYLVEPFIFFFYRRIPFMVGSKSAKKDLTKFKIPSKNITIIPHGVIIEKLKSKKQPCLPAGRKAKIKTIIFLGALAKDKGIEDAIRTFAILNKKGNFQFWVVGKGSKKYLNELAKLARKLGLQKKIKFWGFVSEKRKFELLVKAHVMINPSIREGWGLVNIEANAMATPVVAYNSPGLIDSVREGKSGIICRKNTPEEMANQVLELLNNEALYKQLQKESVIWSKNFSWEKSKQKSLDLITSIVS